MAVITNKLQKALSKFRLKKLTNEKSIKEAHVKLTSLIGPCVSPTPLQALDELSAAFNAVRERALKLPLDKNRDMAIKQENAVLHALQDQYKQNLKKYLDTFRTKSLEEQKIAATIVASLEFDHEHIIYHLDTNYEEPGIRILMQAVNPTPGMPTHILHAPTEQNLRFLDQKLRIKINQVKSFFDEYNNIVNYRLGLIKQMNNPLYISNISDFQQAIALLDTKLSRHIENMKKLATDSDKEISKGAKEALASIDLAAKVESKFLHQLLSGFKNPEKLNEGEKQNYTEEEIAAYAHSLLTIANPLEIFQAIEERYNMATTSLSKKEILSNALVLLHELIIVDNAGAFFPDFTEKESQKSEIGQAFLTLLQKLKADEKNYKLDGGMAAAFERTVRSASELRVASHENAIAQIAKLTTPETGNTLDLNRFINRDLQNRTLPKEQMESTVMKVASDLKKMGQAHLLNIKPTDLYGQAWNKDHKKENTHVIHFIRESGKISNLVINDIVNATSVAHQENIALFYAKVLQQALQDHDYSTAMAIFAGFNSSSVERLKHLKYNKFITPTLDIAKDVFNTDGNYKNLREAMSSNRDAVVVPFLGMYLTDLTFLDSNKALNDKGDINSKQLDLLNNVYHQIDHMIEKTRNQNASQQRTTIFSRVKEIKAVDDNALYASSTKFRGRQAIETPVNDTLEDILAKFPNQEVPPFLEINIINKGKSQLLENKAAYKAILKLIIEKARDASPIQKAEANNLIKNILITAKRNNLATEKVEKLVKAAMIVTDVGAKKRAEMMEMKANAVATLDFVEKAAEEFYQLITLKSQLEGQGEEKSAEHIIPNADSIREALQKATSHPDKMIAAKAKSALGLVDLMNSIPILSAKHIELKEKLINVGSGNDRLKTIIELQDQLEIIENKLRDAAKHTDPRIKIPASLAIVQNQINPEKTAYKALRAKPSTQDTTKKPAIILSQHRKHGKVVDLPTSGFEPVAETQVEEVSAEHATGSIPKTTPAPVKASERVVLNHFIDDIIKAKRILDNFHDILKVKTNKRCTLQNIIKQLNDNNTQTPAFHDANFNISYLDFGKFNAVSTLEYVRNSLNDGVSAAKIDQLIAETAKHWPEGKELLTVLKNNLEIEGSLHITPKGRQSKYNT